MDILVGYTVWRGLHYYGQARGYYAGSCSSGHHFLEKGLAEFNSAVFLLRNATMLLRCWES